MLEIPLIQIKSNVFIKNQIKVHWKLNKCKGGDKIENNKNST